MSSMEGFGRRETAEQVERRRVLRSAILNLTHEAQQDDTTLNPELIRRSNALASQIKDVPEALLDSRLAVILGQKAVRASTKLSVSGVNYNPADFLAHMRRHLTASQGQSSPSARPLSSSQSTATSTARAFMLLSRMVPRKDAIPKTPVIGSFHCEDLKKKQARQRNAPQTQQPDDRTEVRAANSTDGLEERTTKEVDRIFRALRKLSDQHLTPVDYFEFVTDPQSFAATVENMFHLSFLVKQNQVEFRIDDEGTPCLALVTDSGQRHRDTDSSAKRPRNSSQPSPRSAEALNRRRRPSGDSTDLGEVNQEQSVITSISVEDWRRIIDVYGLSNRSIIRRLGGKS